MPILPLAEIALQSTADATLARAVDVSRRICDADAAFSAIRDERGRYPVTTRLGLREPAWDSTQILGGRGMGGQVLRDREPRYSHDYARDPSITPDYVPIMSREHMRGVAVVPIDDLSSGRPSATPLGLIYVSSTRLGAPGDRTLTELHRVAEMAAVGLACLGRTSILGQPQQLSDREAQVLQLLAAGSSNKIIGQRLVISLPTVKTHVRAILRKLDVPSRLAAIAEARRQGLIP